MSQKQKVLAWLGIAAIYVMFAAFAVVGTQLSTTPNVPAIIAAWLFLAIAITLNVLLKKRLKADFLKANSK